MYFKVFYDYHSSKILLLLLLLLSLLGEKGEHIEKNVSICCILNPILDIMLSVKNIRTYDPILDLNKHAWCRGSGLVKI